jgi:hypothetical protein
MLAGRTSPTTPMQAQATSSQTIAMSTDTEPTALVLQDASQM